MLPPVPATTTPEQGQSPEATASGELALSHGQQALEAADYRRAEREFLRAAHLLPQAAAARLGLAEVWLMLAYADRDASLLPLAGQAAQQAALLAPDDEHAQFLKRLIHSPSR